MNSPVPSATNETHRMNNAVRCAAADAQLFNALAQPADPAAWARQLIALDS